MKLQILLLALLILSCGAYDPASDVDLTAIYGNWLSAKSKKVTIPGPSYVTVYDTSIFSFTADSARVTKWTTTLFAPSAKAYWFGEILEDSSYIDAQHKQIFEIKFYEAPFTDSLFHVLYRIDNLVGDSLINMSAIKHDSLILQSSGITKYNENAIVLDSLQLKRIK